MGREDSQRLSGSHFAIWQSGWGGLCTGQGREVLAGVSRFVGVIRSADSCRLDGHSNREYSSAVGSSYSDSRAGSYYPGSRRVPIWTVRSVYILAAKTGFCQSAYLLGNRVWISSGSWGFWYAWIFRSRSP